MNGIWTSSRPWASCESGTKGHGTRAAEIIMDIVPEAELFLSNPPNEEQLADTINWLRTNKVDVVVGSIQFSDLRSPGDGRSLFSRDAIASIKRAVGSYAFDSHTTLWVNAAGNTGEDIWYGPFDDEEDGTGDGYLALVEDTGIELSTVYLKENTDAYFYLRWGPENWGSMLGVTTGAQCDVAIYLLNQSQGGMCICRTAGIGLGISQERLGP